MEVHVPTLHLKSLGELLSNHESNLETLRSSEESTNKEEKEMIYKTYIHNGFDNYENNINIENENKGKNNIIIKEFNHEDEEETLNQKENTNINKTKKEDKIKNKNEKKIKKLINVRIKLHLADRFYFHIQSRGYTPK